MFTLLWGSNTNRFPGDIVKLIDINDTESVIPLEIGCGYTFSSGYKTTHLYITEVSIGVFMLELCTLDTTFNGGHTGINLRMTEKGHHVKLTGGFEGEQYEYVLRSGIYDIEGLNREFWKNCSGYKSIEIIGSKRHFILLCINFLDKTMREVIYH